MVEFETDVLIIGAGPAGATLALALAQVGVRCHAITRYTWLSNSPRAHITNQRTMEVFRDLGVEAEILRYASPWELMGDTLFTTSLAGPEIARIRAWGTGDDRHGSYVAASPSPMGDVPQPYLESVLLRNAAERGAQFLFQTEYLGLVQDADGVTATLRDRRTGRSYQVRAKYLVGADGARSKVVDDIGLPITGRMGRATTAYVQFEADLGRYVAHRPSILYWIASSAAVYGEIGMGLLRAVRPWTHWIAGWGYDPDRGDPDFSEPALRARIGALIGDDSVEIRLGPTSTWLVNEAYAERYSAGRVFAAGDAVHRHPPSGGLGSNTSVQDAFNLAWKLAYVIKEWADPSLLDTYTDERMPVGRHVVTRANASRRDFAALNAVLRDPGSADPVADVVERLAAPGAEGLRARLADAVEQKNYEFNAHGVEMNQRYRSAGIASTAEPAPGSELEARTIAEPGAKLPHTWLVGPDGTRVSTLDIVGKGRMTLVTGLAGTAWTAAVAAIGHPALTIAVIGAPGALDLYQEWRRIRGGDEGGALLVRPDGYIAWRSEAVEDEKEAEIVLRSALGLAIGVRTTTSDRHAVPH